MTFCIRRREFIAGLGSAAAWPLTVGAQQPVMPRIGYLHSGSPGEDPGGMAAFLKGLGETGFVEGRNVAIEHRWAENQYDRFPALAADLVRRGVAVIFTSPPQPGHQAPKQPEEVDHRTQYHPIRRYRPAHFGFAVGRTFSNYG